MGRYPFGIATTGLKKGPWTKEEDGKLLQYIEKHTGHGSWSTLPKRAGLNRCGKSCRLRWTNYLRPDIKRGEFTHEEEQIIINLHSTLGNKWSRIASQLPGRTDNEIKNYWNTGLRKKLLQRGLDPKLQHPLLDYSLLADLALLVSVSNMINHQDNAFMSQADSTQPATIQIQQNLKRPSNVIQFDGLPYNFNTITQSHHEDPSSLGNSTQSLDNFACIDDSMTHYGNGLQVPQVLDTNHKLLKSNYNYLQTEIKDLPGSVPDSGETSNVTSTSSCPAYPSSVSTNCSIFEALERFLNDEASWEDINTSEIV